MNLVKLFAEDRRGLVADISEILGSHSINIEEIDGKVIDGQAVVGIIVDKPSEAVMHLREKGFKVVSDELLTIRIPDEPGASAKVMRELNNAKILIRGISTLCRKEGYTYIALSTENNEISRKLLHDVIV
jgi:hypothetical protein